MRDDLLQRLGLDRDPFPEQPDGLALLTPGLSQRLALLSQLLQSSTRPVLVVAAPGGGVTTWLGEALAHLGPPLRCVQWRATPLATSRELLLSLARSLDAEPHPEEVDSSELADAVRAQLVRFQAANAIPVLLVDDAHQLPQTAMETLLELGDTPAGWLRVVFAGDTSVEERVLRARTDREPEWLPRVELAPLSTTETYEYLDFRLRQSGWRDDLPFDETAFAALDEVAGGIPARINECARQSMEARWPARRGGAILDRLRRMPMAIGGAVAAMLLIAVVWLVWPDEAVEPDAPIATFELPKPTLDEPAAPAPEAPAPLPAPAPAPAPAPVPTTTSEGTIIVPPTADSGQSTAPVAAPTPLPPPGTAAPSPPPPAPPEPVAQPEPAPAASPPSVPPRPLPAPRPKRDAAVTAAAPAAPPAAPAPAAAPETRPAPSVNPTPRPAPDLTASTRGPWGIQLEAFADVIAARAYMQRLGIGSRGGIYRVNRASGSPLFAVILGQFESRQAAAAAIIDLPLTLRAAGPFPRALAGLANVN